ncbi:hypothetical protein SFUMM280S_08349 [Streptomyces fumanus]
MAEVATSARPDQLLLVIDPVARRADGESVRIAKDVLSAGAAHTKVCLPDGPEEFARALRRRGSRRPVVVGDDRALLRAVTLLHRHRELAGCALSLVPVGPVLGLARSLGVPTGAVAAARAVLEGAERRLDLLVDDSDGVVLGAVGSRTVLLSSHILSEVEELCDRVSIIRNGRTVESGSLAELRHLTRTSVTAELAGPPDGLAGLPGVHDLDVRGNRVRLQVDTGHLDAVLRSLGASGVRSLTSTPPTLEELFLRHYQETR